MRVMIVDEKPFILKRFEKNLSEIDGVDIIGKYTNPHKALTAVMKDGPDVIFLDVEMHELNGIDFAEIIKDKIPNTHIVFVTACKDYAIQAFELNAIDYLVRPVNKERLRETIARIKVQKGDMNIPYKKLNKKKVCFFESMNFVNSYGDHIDVQWRTKKTQELFALLVHYHGKKFRKDIIVDQLWPCHNWENGISLLYTAIYHIRKTLKEINFDIEIKNAENAYTLYLNDISFDVDEWTNRIENLPPLSKNTYFEHKEVIKLYKGDYLNDLNYTWAEVEKKRICSVWLYHVKKVANFLVENEEYIEAIKLYHYVQNICPTREESYFNLMKLYNKLNDLNAVEVQYKALKDVLKFEYATEPEMKVQDWFNNWKEQKKYLFN